MIKYTNTINLPSIYSHKLWDYHRELTLPTSLWVKACGHLFCLCKGNWCNAMVPSNAISMHKLVLLAICKVDLNLDRQKAFPNGYCQSTQVLLQLDLWQTKQILCGYVRFCVDSSYIYIIHVQHSVNTAYTEIFVHLLS